MPTKTPEPRSSKKTVTVMLRFTPESGIGDKLNACAVHQANKLNRPVNLTATVRTLIEEEYERIQHD